MSHSMTGVLRGGFACVTLVSLLFVSSLALPRDSLLGQSQAAAAPTICQSSSMACPTVAGLSYASTSEAELTKFLSKIWDANRAAGTLLGTYQLQRCVNPGPAPYRVTCVLWSSGTEKDLSWLKKTFTSSRLFKTITAKFPKT
jgi:hypothetical protein